MSKYRKSFTVDGRRHYVRANTKRELDEKVGRLKAELEAGRTTNRKNITVEEWARGWVDTYKPDASRSYRRSMENILKKLVAEYGDVPMRKLKSRDIQKLVSGLNHYTKATIDQHCIVFAKFFQTAEDSDIISRTPFRGIVRPSGKEKRARRSLTPEEQRTMLTVAETHPFGLFVLIMYYCGLRVMEVAALDCSDVDLDRKIIHVSKAVKADGYIGSPKTAAGVRDVPIPDALAERLKTAIRRPEDRLLVYSTGHPYNRFYVNLSWDSFKQCMRQLSGSIADDLVLYDFRHTYCTNLQAAGVPINVARELMGHSSIKMTATIYTHHSDAAVESAREKINNFDRANRVPKQ